MAEVFSCSEKSKDQILVHMMAFYTSVDEIRMYQPKIYHFDKRIVLS